MRIAHLDTERTWRGGEFQAMSLANILKAHGHDNFIVGRTNSPFLEAAEKAGLERLAVNPLGEWDLCCAIKIRKALIAWKAHILHAHTAHAAALGAMAVSMAGNRNSAEKIKFIIHRRVDYPLNSSFFTHWKYNKADKIIAVSNKVKKALLDSGIPESKIAVVRSGIDSSRSLPSTLTPRKSLGLPESGRIVGFCGALSEQKDPFTFLTAFSLICRQIQDVIGVIVGEGTLRKKMENLIKRLNLEDKIFLLGFRPDVLDILPHFEVFISTSINEGLGTSVMEALWAGVPVVTTPAGGLPEIIEDGVCGLLAPFGDYKAIAESVIKVLSNPELAEKLTVAGRQRAKDLTIEQMAGKTGKIYEEALRNNHN